MCQASFVWFFFSSTLCSRSCHSSPNCLRPESGQVTIMPVRLYLKEATWTLFNKLNVPRELDAVMRSNHLVSNHDMDAGLAAEIDLLESSDVDFVSARFKLVSEKFHHRIQYFATISAQMLSAGGNHHASAPQAHDSSPASSPLPRSPTANASGISLSSRRENNQSLDLSANLNLLKSQGPVLGITGHSGAGAPAAAAVPQTSKSDAAFSSMQAVSSAALRAQLPVHQLRIFFLLRYLRTRMLKQRILYVLNYFRSIEKKVLYFLSLFSQNFQLIATCAFIVHSLCLTIGDLASRTSFSLSILNRPAPKTLGRSAARALVRL